MEHLIDQAMKTICGKTRITPTEYSADLSKLLGHPVFVKLECLQTMGSFKLRGATYYLSTLSTHERSSGVAACSAGNHGLGLAYAAKELGLACTIFVPKSVDQAKFDKLISLGATVHKSGFIGYDDTLAWSKKEAEKLNMPLITAFDDERIMAGNGGTLAVEVLHEVPDAHHYVLPIGGGGLAAGFAYYAKFRDPSAKITVCQLKNSPSFKLSMEQGKAVTHLPPIETLAGGLEGGIGEKCFEILKSRVDDIALIDEDELKSAIIWFLAHHQYLIEPSAAVTLAALLYGHVRPKGPLAVVLSGRNVSYVTLKNIMCRAGMD